MKSLLIFVGLFFSISLFAQEKSVILTNQEIRDGVEIVATNKNFYPVTLEVIIETTNLRSNKKARFTEVLSKNEERKIATLVVNKKNAKWGVSYSYTYYMGSINAKHDDSFAYRFPFKKGGSFRLDQGYGGEYSHQGDELYSLDFNMPIGTPVYAARSGLVIELEEKFTKSGADKNLMSEANFVSVLHNDGTFAVYSHLKKNGVTVQLGQQIQPGQQIGLSGDTGYSTGPHLHFAVMKTKVGGGYITLPTKFATQQGIVSRLEKGQMYKAY